MTRMRLLMVVILILGLPKNLIAMNPQTQLSQYAHTAWRLEDGILNAAPIAIAQTKDGYIWISTEEGVLRFDGVRFVPLADVVGKPLGFSGNVWSLLGAADGSLWIGGSDHLYRWDGVELSTFTRRGRYDAIVEDRCGAIWAVRERVHEDREGALCRPTGATLACFGAQVQLFNSQAMAAANSDDAIWTASGIAVFRLSSGRLTPFSFRFAVQKVGASGVSALAPDSHGGVWVGFPYPGTDLGLEHLKDGHIQRVRISKLDGATLEVRALLSEKNGTLWVGTNTEGILRINGDQVERYDSKAGLSGDGVKNLFEDREGNLWVVTNKGIDRFRDSSVITYSRAQHFSSDYPDAVLTTHDGSVWTTSITGADILHGRSVSRLGDTIRLPGTQGTSLLEDRNGNIWLGLDNDLYRISKGVITPIVTEDGQSVGTVGRMAEDKQGNVWISSFLDVVNDKILFFVKPNDHVARRFVTELGMSAVTMPDIRSGIWIMDRSGKIAHIEGGKTEPERNKLLEQKHPLGLMQGPDGTLYIWCNEGLILIRGDEGRLILDAQLASCRIHQSIFDTTGSLWAAGKCGLIRIQKGEVDQWWNSPDAKPWNRLFFDGKDGYEVNWGDFSPTLSRSPDGKLWFVTRSGLQVVDPAHLYFNSLPPPVVIESLIADHVRVPRLASNRLAARTRDIQIDYTALSFPNPAKVLFQYKLDGHDTDWQDAGARRQAFYTNLTPGHYTFHVKACNNSGVWNEQGAFIQFDIAPAWYQTIWFRVVTAALIICVFLGAYLLRIRVIAERIELRVNERMSERIRISRELHDTVLQALQGLILRFSNLTTRVSPEVQMDMERFLDDAELLAMIGRDRIKEMRGYFPDNAGITTEIQAIASGLFGEHNCQVTIKTNGESAPLSAFVYDDALWIAREAISNACRHSHAKHLNIEVSFTSSDFRMLIQDDGVGLDANAFLAHYRGHFGLASMRERADLIGGRLNVSSASGKGTAITLLLPARIAYVTPQSWFRRLLSRRFN
jgi:signal transduction histidine kinase/ligand-binding sensor domain-containing protein